MNGGPRPSTGGSGWAASAASPWCAVVPLLLLGACARGLPPGDPDRPDILLISIDTLRPDHLGAYGYSRPTSPRIDALAARGLRFDHARAASPWTLPSHMTMFTGLWPTEHQVIEDTLRLSPTVPLITESLHDAGYSTAAFVSTIYVSHLYGFDRGFDRFEDYDISEKENLHHQVRVDRVTADAWAYAQSAPAGKPMFVFLHSYDVHYPYLPPAPFDSRFDRVGTTKEAAYRTYAWFLKHPLTAERLAHQEAQYDEAIAAVDQEIGELVARWEASGRKLTVIVTSDHGEELGERGSWGHGHTLYAEALRIPLVMVGPGITPAVRNETVGTIDIAATIAALAGKSWPGAGRDLRGDPGTRNFPAETSRFDTNRLSLLEGALGGGAASGLRLDLDLSNHRRALYDTINDPKERTNLAGSRAADADRLERELYESLGESWSLTAGSLTTPGGLWRSAAAVASPLEVAGPFGLWPPDAAVTHTDGAAVTRSLGVIDAPTTGPWTYSGAHRSVTIALDDATKAQLEALGYVQGTTP